MKKIYSLGCVVIIAVAACFTFNKALESSENFSYLALAHIEALAQNESGGSSDTEDCWTYYYWGSADKNICTLGSIEPCELGAWIKPHSDYKHECRK